MNKLSFSLLLSVPFILFFHGFVSSANDVINESNYTKITSLIEKLGDDDFNVRDKSVTDLKTIIKSLYDDSSYIPGGELSKELEISIEILRFASIFGRAPSLEEFLLGKWKMTSAGADSLKTDNDGNGLVEDAEVSVRADGILKWSEVLILTPKEIIEADTDFVDKVLAEDNSIFSLLSSKIDSSKTDYLPLLKKLLSAVSSPFRGVAIHLIGSLGVKESAVDLVQFLLDADPNVRVVTASALSALDNKSVAQDISLLLKYASPNARNDIVNVLCYLRENSILNNIIPLLEEPDSKMRISILRLLAVLKPKEAVGHILPLLKDKDVLVKTRTLQVLSNIGDKTVIDEIIPLLNDGNPSVRSSAVYAVSNLGSAEHAKYLLPLLKDRYELVKSETLLAVMAIGDSTCSGEVIGFLKDSNPSNRETALTILRRIGNKEYAQFILPLLNDDDLTVRLIAIDTIGLLGNVDVIPQVLALLNDANASIRRNAVSSLGMIGNLDTAKRLAAVLVDDNFEVRQSASIAIYLICERTVNDNQKLAQKREFQELVGLLGKMEKNKDESISILAKQTLKSIKQLISE